MYIYLRYKVCFATRISDKITTVKQINLVTNLSCVCVSKVDRIYSCIKSISCAVQYRLEYPSF